MSVQKLNFPQGAPTVQVLQRYFRTFTNNIFIYFSRYNVFDTQFFFLKEVNYKNIRNLSKDFIIIF